MHATGTEPETASEQEDGSDDEEDQGQGESTGITSGLEPQNLITDEHELRELGKGADDEDIENTFHVDGMTTLADPDLDRPKVPVTRSGSVGKVPKKSKVTNSGPVPKEKFTQGSKGKSKSRKKRQATVLTEAMQTDHAGITDDLVIEGNFSDDSHAEAELERLERESMRSRDIITDGHTSWTKICKLVHKHQKPLPFELHSLYRLWLLTRPVQPDEDVLTPHDLRDYARAGVL